MANYIAWYGKKRQGLAQDERAFVALLDANPTPETLAAAIERVRAAQVRMLKARRAEYAPSEKNAAFMSELGNQIERWQTLRPRSIVDYFRQRQHRNRDAAHRKGAR